MILFENNYLISIIISLLLINGFYNLSFRLSSLTNKYLSLNNITISTILNFLFLVNFLAIITFNTLLYFNINKNLIFITSIVIIILGLYKPTYLKEILQKTFKKKDIKENTIYLILFFYFILSLNPITDPDSLDYHLTIPYYQIEFSNPQFSKYWLHSQLSGSGEALMLYGVVLGAFHFSQVLQFVSLLFIIMLILNFHIKKINININKRNYVCLVILTMPIFLFLSATSKPQLLPIATNFFTLIFAFFYLNNVKIKNYYFAYTLTIFLLFCSTQMKFSFFLSSGLITLFIIYQCFKKKIFLKPLIIISILFLAIIIPREIYEYINFNTNIIYNFLNPVTDIHAADKMNDSLRHGTGNSRYFIFWLFAPLDLNGKLHFGNLTYCLGPFVLYFLFNYRLDKVVIKKITFLYILYFLVALNLAQPVGRFYAEVFIWMLFFSILYSNKNNNFFKKIFEKIILTYSFLFLIILGFMSLNLFKGNISAKLYDQVMSNNTDGYLIYKWANEVLPDNSVIISTHRSNALYKYEVIPYEFRLFGIDNKKSNEYYLNEIIKKNPKFVLYKSTELNDKRDILKNCRGELFRFKKNVGFAAGRNPFRQHKYYYDGYIYKISSKQIKECIR